MTKPSQTIGIIGAGAWGTALAQTIAGEGHAVTLQAHEAEVVEAINTTHENTTFLPGITLSPAVRATGTLAEAVRGADAVLVVTPAQFLRATLAAARADWPEATPVVICSKGIEQRTGLLMSEVAAEVLPDVPVAALSGPTFAIEVARGLPTGAVLAAADAALAERLARMLGTRTFRLYHGTDIISAEVGGAVKNVLAIACGIVAGRKLGDNARATLITRGLAEIVRLAEARGGRAETLMGLSGLGDLTLTANAMQSRNFSLGVALGEGKMLDDIMGARTSVAEGVFTAAAVVELAGHAGVDMPICTAVDRVLNQGADLDETIQWLLSRPVGEE